VPANEPRVDATMAGAGYVSVSELTGEINVPTLAVTATRKNSEAPTAVGKVKVTLVALAAVTVHENNVGCPAGPYVTAVVPRDPKERPVNDADTPAGTGENKVTWPKPLPEPLLWESNARELAAMSGVL